MNPLDLYARVEARLDPLDDADRAAEAALRGGLDAHAAERPDRLPVLALRALLQGPVGAELVPPAEGGRLVWDRALRICGRLAAADLDLTLCLGGVVLAALPVVVAGDPAQRARFFAGVRDGGLAGLGLSEWDRGSDLLQNDTVATPLAGGRWRIDGHKRPCNNGSVGRHVVVLARTGDAEDAFGATLFLLTRGTPGLLPDAPLDWVGCPQMDLSGIRLEGVEVGSEAVLGKPGEGFVHARRTLEITRSGVAAMSLGAHGAALALAAQHARERRLYGAPIATLGGVRALLTDTFTRLALAVATGRRAARAAGRFGVAARDLTSAAKLVCPDLLEASVHAAGVVLGARSLTRAPGLAALRRDAPIFGIFDGSSQLQLDELWRYARRWPEAAVDPRAARAALRAPVDDFDPWAEDTDGVLTAASPSALLATLSAGRPPLAPFAALARQATAAARAAPPQPLRFAVSEAAAWCHALAALADAADAPATRCSRPPCARPRPCSALGPPASPRASAPIPPPSPGWPPITTPPSMGRGRG
ncbi:MAG: acyl-CoA dehydrogenase [Myxococcales bacterium]|nr:acyl-CoA dehydrogenase [Myxococcales bacterium]